MGFDDEAQTPGVSREAARAGRALRGSRRYNRCKMVLPDDRDLVGRRVLDLECRGGLGAFQIADRVGRTGRVIGVDSRAEHIERAVARAPEQHWAGERWGDYLRFVQASPDDLRAAGIEDDSVDVVIINSVLNVLPDRAAALREMVRVLVSRGYLYLDAVLAVDPVPAEVARRPGLAGNPFAAAPTRAQLADELRLAGFTRSTFSNERLLSPEREDVAPELTGLLFASAIVQAWA